MRAVVIWAGLLLALGAPFVLAAFSPQLAWREPIYIASSFAGIAALALLVIQPLLAAGSLPGVAKLAGRRVHTLVGAMLVFAVLAHVAGLWITSPPDVVDALLFVSPTPFSLWGVIAMWALLATACLAALRGRLRLRWVTWRALHLGLAIIIVACTVAHALLIEGIMESQSKVLLCVLAVLVALPVVLHRRAGRQSTVKR
ncbi:MAG: ferric reductase-like transmembrane domain-containing protein [Pseudomonadota bacterium]